MVSVLQLNTLFDGKRTALTAVLDSMGRVRLLRGFKVMAPRRWMMVAIALVFGSGCVLNKSFDCPLY